MKIISFISDPFFINDNPGIWEEWHLPLPVWHTWEGGRAAVVSAQGEHISKCYPSHILYTVEHGWGVIISTTVFEFHYENFGRNSWHFTKLRCHCKALKCTIPTGGSDEKLWKVCGLWSGQREIKDADLHQAWTLCQVPSFLSTALRRVLKTQKKIFMTWMATFIIVVILGK